MTHTHIKSTKVERADGQTADTRGPKRGAHGGALRRQTDTPGPAAATSTQNIRPRWTGGGPDTTPETAPDETNGLLGGAATTTSKASLESRRVTGRA